MKKSVVLTAYFSDSINQVKSFEEALHVIQSYQFYDCVEFYFEGTSQDRQQIKLMLENTGLSSVYLAGYPMKRDQLNLGDLDDEKREYAIQRVCGLIDEAYAYGSEKMLFVSGAAYATDDENERSFARLVDATERLCVYAQQKATNYVLELSLEYFNHVGEPYYLLGPTVRTKHFAEQVNDRLAQKNLRLTFDMSHAIQLGEDPYESLSSVGALSRHIHLANCVTRYPEDSFFGDKHPPFAWPNSDVNEQAVKDYVAYVYSLQPGEDTILGVEVITPEGLDGKKVLHESTKLFMEAVKNY